MTPILLRSHLSARQREIITLVAAGYTNPAIAHRLHVTVNTVKSHMESIYFRLGVKDRAHAVAVAMRAGEIQ